MFRSVIFAITISVCFALDLTLNPPIRCGEMPNKILDCLGNPSIFANEMLKNCASTSKCDIMTCAFNNFGWLKDGTVQKAKIDAYFDQFAVDHPKWSDAVRNTKKNCVSTPLPAQGVYLNCPAYDIMHCTFTNFAQYAEPSLWSKDAQCEYPKQYVAACPMCPSACFSAQVPYGSCNACLGLPRSP